MLRFFYGKNNWSRKFNLTGLQLHFVSFLCAFNVFFAKLVVYAYIAVLYSLLTLFPSHAPEIFVYELVFGLFQIHSKLKFQFSSYKCVSKFSLIASCYR